MGTRTGRFTSIEGREYLVEFTGDSVKNAELVLGVPPVVISMAPGEHKFCGFKSTTAVVNLLTDKPLYDLYTESADGVRVTVKDVAENKVEFDGYVVPFVFEQPRSDMNDAVTINAVDMLTARKSYTYENVGDVHGVDKTALEIVQEICRRSGIYRLAVHLNFSTPDDKASPLDVMVAQAGFLQDEMSDVDALSAICQFFGYTGHVAGDTLYLYDEHCLCTQYSVNIYTYVTIANTGKTTWHMDQLIGYSSPLAGQEIFLDGDILAGMTTSVERAYDGIQITPQGSDVSVLLPDVCARENSSENDNSLGTETRTFQDRNAKVDYTQDRTPRRSDVMELGMSWGDEIVDRWSEWGSDPVVSPDWFGGAMLLDVVHCNRKRYNKPAGENYPSVNLVTKVVAKEGNMIWMSGANNTDAVVGEQREHTRYSHTGGRAKLTLSWILMPWENWINMTDPIEQSDLGVNPFGEAKFLRVTCGDKKYIGDNISAYERWKGLDFESMSVFYTDGESTTLLPTNISGLENTNEVLLSIPNNGQVSVGIGWFGHPTIYYNGWNIYITSLSLVGYGANVNTACDGLRHSFSNRPGGDYLTVNTALTTRGSDSMNGIGTGINARPGVVTGGEWVGVYKGGGNGTSIPIAGVLMEQLKNRYQYTRYAYTFTTSKRVYPYQAVWVTPMTSALRKPTHTVESYDWDIYNNETTITID